MASIIGPPSANATQEAQRLLRETKLAARPSTKLLHRVRSKLQYSKSDNTFLTLVKYIDNGDARSLDIVEALLHTLKYQSSIEKFQSVSRRLLVIAGDHGHAEILKYLLVVGGDIDLSRAEALLQDAVFFGHKSCVEVLLQNTHNTDAVLRALLTTDSIELDQAREIIRLLLNSKLPRSVLDYLELKMYASRPTDFDSEILEMLIAANVRSSSRDDTKEVFNSKELQKYFDIQRQVRTFSIHHKASPHVLKMPANMFQIDELYQPIRNMFGDNIITDPQNLVLKLLEKYLQDCSVRKGLNVQWPWVTVDLLLNRMPNGAEELHEYVRCILLAAKFQQTTVFTQLLRHRLLSVRTIRSLSQPTIVTSAEILTALLDFLRVNLLSDRTYLEITSDLLGHACKAKLLPRAVQICSQSRIPVSISAILTHVRLAISCDANMQDKWISELFNVAKAGETDLKQLWEYVLSADRFPTATVRVLLRAGYDNSDVESLFLKSIRTPEKLPNLSMMIDEWKIPKIGALRNNFDYRTGKSVRDGKPIAIDSQQPFFATLAAALQMAIERQQLDVCLLLLAKGAPLVSVQTSLLEKAVFCGTKHSTIAQDKILDLILEAEKARTDLQSVLDFTLLQAVKSHRCLIVAELIDQGASTIAYDHECWHLAFLSKDELLFETFLATIKGAAELSQNFVAVFTSFSSNFKAWIPLLGRLHKAGFTNSRCYSDALQILIRYSKLTDQSMEELIECGAFLQRALEERLPQLWLNDDLQAVQVLTKRSISQTAAETLFTAILSSCVASTTGLRSADGRPLDRSKAEIVFDIMNSLLRMEMPTCLLEVALSTIASLRDEPVLLRAPILITVLTKGARFAEDDGLALLHCLLMDDSALSQQVDASCPPVKARQAALQFCLYFPHDMGILAQFHRVRALTRLLYPPASTPIITLTHHNVMSITSTFLSPHSDTPTDVIHHFYRWLQNKTAIRIRDAKDVAVVEKKLDCIVEGLVSTEDVNFCFVDRVLAVLHYVSPATVSSDSKCFSPRIFRISQASISRYLIATAKAGLSIVVEALLKAGANPNVLENGKSALLWAANANKLDTARALISAGAHLDDGSLHEAICQQNLPLIQILLNAGHDQAYISRLHGSMTPLLAFVDFDHAKSDPDKFSETMNTLMNSRPITPKICSEVKAAIEAAMSNTYAFELILALLPWLRLCFSFDTLALQVPICKGPLRYSLLSFIDLWKYCFLTPAQKGSLVRSLRDIGFEEMFYTTEEGGQPANAVNVPEAILAAEEARRRHSAFVAKECCICGERPGNENEIHSRLAPTCAASHSWKNDIVCADCLKQYLEGRMFPHDDVAIKYKFPSTKIPCWAPKCETTELPYNSLKQYIDMEVFHLYDDALCQALLREGKAMVKCATSDCLGAHWYDDSDEYESVKIFWCEICFQNTCTECNDLYEKHDKQPCPAGEEARKSERIKEEEKLSAEALKLEKRCPRCKLMYQRYAGCEHIVCGKNSTDNKVDSKFLPLSCLGVCFVSMCADESCRRMSLRILRYLFRCLA